MSLLKECLGCAPLNRMFPEVASWEDRLEEATGSPVNRTSINTRGDATNAPPEIVALKDGRCIAGKQVEEAWHASRDAQQKRLDDIAAFTVNCPGLVAAEVTLYEMPVTVRICGAVAVEAANMSAEALLQA